MIQFVEFESLIGTMLVRKDIIWGVTVSRQDGVPSEVVLEGGSRSIKVTAEVAEQIKSYLATH